MNKILNAVAGNFFTPKRSDNKSFGNNLETNSVTSEALNSSDSQSPISSNKTSKAYTQQDLDKLKAEMEEQFRIQLAIDQKQQELKFKITTKINLKQWKMRIKRNWL